jgi:hypothetical protein
MADEGFIGDPRPSHPIPLRLRNPFIEREDGGSKGYRGPGYQAMRKRILYLARYRSAATGYSQQDSTLFVDHIIPYRIGGLTSHTNEQTNFRILDAENNKFLDHATGFEEKPVKRLRAF